MNTETTFAQIPKLFKVTRVNQYEFVNFKQDLLNCLHLDYRYTIDDIDEKQSFTATFELNNNTETCNDIRQLLLSFENQRNG